MRWVTGCSKVHGVFLEILYMDVVDPWDHGSRIKNLQSSSGTARDDDYHHFTMIIKSDDVDDGHDEFYQLPNKTLEHPTDHLHQPRHPNLPLIPIPTGFRFTGFGSILGGSSPDQEVRKLKVNGTWKKWDPFPFPPFGWC